MYQYRLTKGKSNLLRQFKVLVHKTVFLSKMKEYDNIKKRKKFFFVPYFLLNILMLDYA